MTIVEEFFARLKEHKLVQWTLAYIAVSFGMLPVLDIVAERFGWSHTVERCVIIGLATGFFMMLVIAWFHGERGQKRVTRTEHVLLAVLVLLGGLSMWRIGPAPVKQASAKSVAAAPKTVVPTAPIAAPIPAKSIAVLPLLNESGDPGQDYFSDGLSEELISALAQVHGLKVIGRNSSFQFRGRQQDDTVAIGVKLGVATLLEGTVRKQGNQIRIVASLIKASDGSQLWSQTYDRELKDVFAVQSDVAKSVAGALKITLLGESIKVTDRPPNGNLDAYDAMLKGVSLAAHRNKADYLLAVGQYQRAIKLDPEYAMAYARLAIAQQWFNDWVATGAERTIVSVQARANALKAVQLAPDSALALGALGINQAWSDFDYPSAEVTLKKAVELDSSNPEILYQLADVTACLGRLDEAVAMMWNVLKLEPLNASYHFYTGQFLLAMGNFDAAQTELQRAVEQQPHAEVFRAYLAIALLERGDPDQALEVAKTEPQGASRRWALALIYFARGEDAQGQATLEEMVQLDANFSPSNIAIVYAMRGDNNNAFIWLNRALDVRDPGVASIYEQPYLISKLRNDPRLAVLLKKLNLPTPDEVNARRVSANVSSLMKYGSGALKPGAVDDRAAAHD